MSLCKVFQCFQRNEQRKKCKERTMERIKAELQAQKAGSMTCVPRSCVRPVPEVGVQWACRWRCEQILALTLRM